jgi:hypothetical protein
MLLTLAAGFCVAAEQPAQPAAKAAAVSEDNFWQEDNASGNPRMSEERMNQFLEQIRKDNPARANELEKLRKDNPDEFRTQLRAEFIKQMRQRGGDHDGGPGGPQGPTPPGRPEQPGQPGRGPMGEGPSGERWRERMEKMHNEFIAWLEKNYPDQAEAIKPLREKQPEEYMAKAMELRHRYEPIMRAEKDNPKLAQAMKDDIELQKQQDALLRQIHSANGKEKEKLVAELKDNVSRRFDVIMSKKQLQYDDLKKRLEKLKTDVKAKEGELEKLKTTKDKAVTEHLSELVGKAEKVQWD